MNASPVKNGLTLQLYTWATYSVCVFALCMRLDPKHEDNEQYYGFGIELNELEDILRALCTDTCLRPEKELNCFKEREESCKKTTWHVFSCKWLFSTQNCSCVWCHKGLSKILFCKWNQGCWRRLIDEQRPLMDLFYIVFPLIIYTLT